MLSSIKLKIKKVDEFFSNPAVLYFIIFFLAITLGFGLGYLYRGEINRAPIVIEKRS